MVPKFMVPNMLMLAGINLSWVILIKNMLPFGIITVLLSSLVFQFVTVNSHWSMTHIKRIKLETWMLKCGCLMLSLGPTGH